jgi:hypothetical protein
MYLYDLQNLEQQSNIENKEAWCDEMGIENYTINSKGEIDVDGQVNLFNKAFKELPYKFGRVNGYFSLENCKNLTSLKNCPKEVDGFFSCSFCHQLDSLEGCPKKVRDNFYCGRCKRTFTKEEVQSLCKVKRDINN